MRKCEQHRPMQASSKSSRPRQSIAQYIQRSRQTAHQATSRDPANEHAKASLTWRRPTSLYLPKNQLPLLPLLSPPASCICRLLRVGMFGPPPSMVPPPLSGFAIREPAPPKPNTPAPSWEARPRVEPSLAASSRSLTAASWVSNLHQLVRITEADR